MCSKSNAPRRTLSKLNNWFWAGYEKTCMKSTLKAKELETSILKYYWLNAR